MRLPDSLDKRGWIKPGKMEFKNGKIFLNIHFNIPWWGWALLVWDYAHKEFKMKWFNYPKLFWIMAKAVILCPINLKTQSN